jgi:predicted HD superfamily hydrolase involved in NAD metabolism
LEIEECIARLEQVLTPARFRHSLGVMQVMGELAPVYGLDMDLSERAGLLHDAAKDFGPDEQERAVQQAGIVIREPAELDYNLYMHGPISALVAEATYGVRDRLVLNAIRTHTAMDGEDFNHPLSWCLRFSDLLEPNRNWQNVPWLFKGLPRLRAAVFGGRLEEAALLQYGWVQQWFTAFGYPVHSNVHRIVGDLYLKLQLDPTFLE